MLPPLTWRLRFQRNTNDLLQAWVPQLQELHISKVSWACLQDLGTAAFIRDKSSVHPNKSEKIAWGLSRWCRKSVRVCKSSEWCQKQGVGAHAFFSLAHQWLTVSLGWDGSCGYKALWCTPACALVALFCHSHRRCLVDMAVWSCINRDLGYDWKLSQTGYNQVGPIMQDAMPLSRLQTIPDHFEQ